jgi:hypothetical protein
VRAIRALRGGAATPAILAHAPRFGVRARRAALAAGADATATTREVLDHARSLVPPRAWSPARANATAEARADSMAAARGAGGADLESRGLPARVRRGIEEFNRGEYYECHETLEREWLRESGPIRVLWQGILQVGVGLHHARADNLSGARRVLARGKFKLLHFLPAARGIDVARLLRDVEAFETRLGRPPSSRRPGR